VRLVWNGSTKADFRAQYTEALAEERSGRPDDAEAKFRSALEGLDRLLSTTHPETVAVAYKLASFFADRVRMQDADTVLDWLNQAHLKDFGLGHARTLDHILSVCDMLRNWGRPEQAADLLQQVFHEADKEPSAPDTTHPPITDQIQRTHASNAYGMTDLQAQEYGIPFSIPTDGPLASSTLRVQISRVIRDGVTNHDAEAILLRLIRHCEQYPDELLVYSLLCYPVLLDYYEDRDDVVKRSDALDRAEQALWTVLQSTDRKTRDDLVACLQLAKSLVKAARYESADDIFSQIECEAQETFGPDGIRTIWFLENIATFYQNEGRWQDAAPRFEHALAARLSRYGERHESVRRLEDALETRHFEAYVPSQDKDMSEDIEARHPGHRCHAPEVIVMGPHSCGRMLKCSKRHCVAT
jgi:tetratricopeptide (TPR) repeat protein